MNIKKQNYFKDFGAITNDWILQLQWGFRDSMPGQEYINVDAEM